MASRSYRFSLEQWNGPQLANRAPRILTTYRTAIDKQFKEEIAKPQFSWSGRLTQRRNGETVGSPRNIVDTGAFLRSQRASTKSSAAGTEITFTWGNAAVSYAGIILQGKGPTYPARDWIQKAVDAQPFQSFFAREWAKLERRGL